MGDFEWEVSRIPPVGFSLSDIAPDKRINIILENGTTICGRAVANQIRCESILSSRRHCSITLKNDNSLFLKDLTSLNGTFLNGTKIITEREIALNDGDVIGVGVDPNVDLTTDHPVAQQYILKISKKMSPLAGVAVHSLDTVPSHTKGSYILNPTRTLNLNEPSTSYCSGDRTVNVIDSSKISDPPKSAEIVKAIEVIDVVDSDEDEEEEINQVDTNTSNALPLVLNELVNSNPESVITINSQTDTPVLESADKDPKENGQPKPLVLNEVVNSKNQNVITIDSQTDTPVLESADKVPKENGQPKPLVLNEVVNSKNQNVITIDSQTDTAVLESADKVPNQNGQPKESYSKKVCVNNIPSKGDMSADVNSEELVSIDWIYVDVCQEGDDLNENAQSSSQKSNDNISLSSNSSVRSDQNNLNEQVDNNCGRPNNNLKEQIIPQDDNLLHKENENAVRVDLEENCDNLEENCERGSSLNIKEEIHRLDAVVDEIIYIEDDDDGELPCSQVFDFISETNLEVQDTIVEEKNPEDPDCWYAVDDSDSDSDAEQWFQRLSQSHQHDSEDEEREESLGVKTKEKEEYGLRRDENCETSGESCAGNDLQKDLAVHDIFGNLESEPILRTIPSGGKRKLSISSEEDVENDIFDQVKETDDLSKAVVASSSGKISTGSSKIKKSKSLKKTKLVKKHKQVHSDDSDSWSWTSCKKTFKRKLSSDTESSTSRNEEVVSTNKTNSDQLDADSYEMISQYSDEIADLFITINKEEPNQTVSNNKTHCDYIEDAIKPPTIINKPDLTEITKLNDISKKVNSSFKKKAVPIIEAQPIKSRKKSTNSELENVNQINEKLHEKKHDQWLSNTATKKSQQPHNKADAKAYRKEKLKDLALKGQENKQQDKQKKGMATSKAKTTSNSRSDRLLQDLVCLDSRNDKTDKLKKKDSMVTYKIPRRPSTTEENVDVTVSVASTSKEPEQNNQEKNSTLKPQRSATATTMDQILKNVDGKLGENSLKTCKSQVKPSVFGVENEEPMTVITLDEQDYKTKFPLSGCHPPSKRKSLLKCLPIPKDKLKKVKFNFPNDSKNIIYRTIREFSLDEGSQLKRVTKHVRKEFNMKANKPCLRRSEDSKFTNYWEETIYAILKWNCSWFEEKDKVKKDPPAFSGQVYHLNDEFTDYSDYRRGYFPLLMYELWGTVSKHFDQVIVKPKDHNRNPPFYVDLRAVKFREVMKKFFTSEKTEVLLSLHCQVLLDKKRPDIWPRAGDLVLVSLTLKPSKPVVNNMGVICQIRGGEKRLLGYVAEVPKFGNLHADVSPNLRSQHPNANVVLDGLTVLMTNRGQEIDATVLPRIKILKNIKPELRAFEALDRLITSPLFKQICQPKYNLTNVNNFPDLTSQPLPTHLNPAQKKAVINIARECIQDANMIHLVHGPPGCGKSEVIANIILQMWHDWHVCNKFSGNFQQILLCAPSNSAIDELVTKLVNRRDELFNVVRGIPKFKLVRVGVEQSTHESCSRFTLDYLTKMELKRLTEVKADENQKGIEIQCLEAKKHQLSQKLDSLIIRKRNMDTLPYLRGDKKKEDMIKEIQDVEKKLAETKAKISYFESGKEPNGREMASKYKETQLELLQKANIVATTLSSCYNGIMAEAYSKKFIMFDCCIVDEATQCTEPDTLIPLMLGVRKLVLVGDPKQLPATVVTSTAKLHRLEKSMFARHYDWWKKQQILNAELANPCYFLNIQYRMHPEIAQWPSEYFYENRLLSPESLRDRSLSFPLVPYAVLSHDHKQNAKEGECNEEESRLVAHIVRGIANHQLCRNVKISVITPYNRQKDDLKRRVNLREFPNIEIGTVDSYQGRESDVVIFSCVRTEGVGFLGGQERLNVALTRAKHSLIIVGNFMSLQRDSTWNSLLNNAKSRNVFKPIINKNAVSSLIFKSGLLGGSG